VKIGTTAQSYLAEMQNDAISKGAHLAAHFKSMKNVHTQEFFF